VQDGNQVEWDFNGYVTNPFSSMYKADQVIDATRKGQHIDDANAIHKELDADLNTPD
jgi:hypothetical protein